MRAIVESVNADPALALRASANPILALEELGYSLTDAFRVEAGLRARFDEDDAKRMLDLRARVLAAIGADVDLESAGSVTQAVRRLGVELERQSKRSSRPATSPFPASDSRSLLPH